MNPDELAKLLVLAIGGMGGELTISKKLLDDMAPHMLVFDPSDPEVVKLRAVKQTVLVGKVDNGIVEVVL